MGHSIVYDMGMQLAAYMGFSEIYLLGVDHSWNGHPTDEGNHFITGYYNQKENFAGIPLMLDDINLAYMKAEQYSRQHGFRIYNATRGGKLEIFERVNFDSLW